MRALVHAGATVLGPKPSIAPGLSDYPIADAEVRELADELWGVKSGVTRIDRRVGKGRVLAGISAGEALTILAIQPDVSAIEPVQQGEYAWIHRSVGADEFYFISNQQDQPRRLTLSFRVDGKCVQLWRPDTGVIEAARNWTIRDGRTEVSLDLDPCDSVFVRLTPGELPALPVALLPPKLIDILPVSGSWKVQFPSLTSPLECEFKELESWTERDESEIRYYSGIAIYEKKISLPADCFKLSSRIVLDLGTVCDLARVSINGKFIADLWKPPYQVDVTSAVNAGENLLTVQVANVWANRLAGDEYEPDDVMWNEKRFNSGKLFAGQSMKEYPAWLASSTTRPSSRRQAFCTFKLVEKGQSLYPAGLIGPVEIRILEK